MAVGRTMTAPVTVGRVAVFCGTSDGGGVCTGAEPGPGRLGVVVAFGTSGPVSAVPGGAVPGGRVVLGDAVVVVEVVATAASHRSVSSASIASETSPPMAIMAVSVRWYRV